MRKREDLTLAVCAKDKEAKVISKDQKAIEAFVTFKSESGFIKAMLKYNLNWFRTNCCCYPGD